MTSTPASVFSPSLLAEHRISSLPDSFYYIANFLTQDEQETIRNKLPANKWISLSRRRLQVHPSQLTNSNVLLDAPLPTWLTASPPIAKRFEELGIFHDAPHGKANHCLINEYKSGEGIMPHEDGSAYHPIVATVSLGGIVALDISEKRNEGEESSTKGLKLVTRILQEPGSLLVTTGDAYSSLLHGISPIEEDVDLGSETIANWALLEDATRGQIVLDQRKSVRATRTSLTFRDVLKVKKISIGVIRRR